MLQLHQILDIARNLKLKKIIINVHSEASYKRAKLIAELLEKENKDLIVEVNYEGKDNQHSSGS